LHRFCTSRFVIMLRLTCCMEYTCCWTGLYMMFKHRFMYPLLFCLPYTCQYIVHSNLSA